jgi:hypothetical protein
MMKKHFTNTVMSVYPLLHVNMPEYVPGMPEVQAQRNDYIRALETGGLVNFLTNSSLQFRAFDVEEVDYNYCRMVSA